MNKIKSIMCLCMALAILYNSSVIAFASENENTETTGMVYRYEKEDFTIVSDEIANAENWNGEYQYDESGNIIISYCSESYFNNGYYDTIQRSATLTISAEYSPFWYVNELSSLLFLVYLEPNSTSLSWNPINHKQNVVIYNEGELYREETQNTGGIPMNGVYVSNIPIFTSLESARAWTDSMDDSGIQNKKPVLETYDKSIGYLHGLEYNYLVQTDEEGVPTEAYYQFTWDKYYEKYDNSYSVDIYAVCNLETKQFFGLGKSKITQSERMYIKTVPYLSENESGSAEITNSEMNEIFSAFWSADEKIYESRAWTYDYYFRIVKDGKYGPWTIYDHKYGPLTGSDEADIYVAEDDEKGNLIKDIETDYGAGITYDPNVGVGGTKNEAFEDLLDDETFSPANISQWFAWLYDVFSNMIASLGQFPQFIGQVFTFLPSEITMLLCTAIVICVVCRLLGR